MRHVNENMYFIFCIDDKDGLAFNKRHQSSDQVVTRDIVDLAAGAAIRIAPCSAGLFKEFPNANIKVSKYPERDALKGEFCFMERNLAYLPAPKQIEGIILYFWNRVYPADIILDRAMFGNILKQTPESIIEFPGYSHEKIRREIYR